MSRFLICTVPMAGHVNPALPIARTLVERGHDVLWYTGRRWQAAIEAIGAHYMPMQAAFDPGDGDCFVKLPDLKGLQAANWALSARSSTRCGIMSPTYSAFWLLFPPT